MKKAIKFFEEEITRLENAPKINGCEMTDEWAEQIEFCKTAKSAIEKQIPKKPIKANRIIKKDGAFFLNDDNEYFKCPICTAFDVPLLKNQEYCHCCGQAIDWSDTE